MQVLPWFVALVAVALLASLATLFVLRAKQRPRVSPLPADWALAPRPVFSADERRAYRLLREALPHQVVLAKLPLVRFCKPADPAQARRWYDLLGAINVTFAICSANGRVLAAVDLVGEGAGSRRAMQIKQAVLSACRIRHLRCPAGKLPSTAELQMLLPQDRPAAGAPLPSSAPPPSPSPSSPVPLSAPAPLRSPASTPTPVKARDSLSNTAAYRRAERSAQWQDSGTPADSFFAPDSRVDSLAGSQFAALAADVRVRAAGRPSGPAGDDIAGVVVDLPPEAASGARHRA